MAFSWERREPKVKKKSDRGNHVGHGGKGTKKRKVWMEREKPGCTRPLFQGEAKDVQQLLTAKGVISPSGGSSALSSPGII